MSAYDVMIETGAIQGWDVALQLELACQYIDNQQSNEAFYDFLAAEAAREEDASPVVADGSLSPTPEDEYLLSGIMQLAQLVADLTGILQYMDASSFTGKENEKLSIVQIRLALIRWGKWSVGKTNEVSTV